MIAAKTGLSYDYISSVLFLLEHGEQRLLAAVEAGNMPITVAVPGLFSGRVRASLFPASSPFSSLIPLSPANNLMRMRWGRRTGKLGRLTFS